MQSKKYMKIKVTNSKVIICLVVLFIFWYCFIAYTHSKMTPRQIFESGEYFKRILPLMRFDKLLIFLLFCKK
jgi:hypothetical protein